MCNVLYNVLCPPLEQALDDPPLRRLDLQSLGLLFSDRLGVAAYEAQAVQVGTPPPDHRSTKCVEHPDTLRVTADWPRVIPRHSE